MTYDVSLKNVKNKRKSGIMFLAVGILFLAVFGYLAFSTMSKKAGFDSEVKASKVEWSSRYDEEEDSTTYSPIYYYTVSGVEYTCDSNVSSSIKSGKGIVYYDSKDPSNCITDFETSTNYFVLIFLLLPLLFIGIGISQIKNSIKKSKLVNNLANNGILVKGIPYTTVDSNFYVNDVPIKQFLIKYTFPDGKTREFKSEPVFDQVLQDYDGKCDLLYDPNNYDNYFIELEITATGHGTPTIIQYNQAEQGANNLNYANMNKNFNNESNSYNPENKY